MSRAGLSTCGSPLLASGLVPSTPLQRYESLLRSAAYRLLFRHESATVLTSELISASCLEMSVLVSGREPAADGDGGGLRRGRAGDLEAALFQWRLEVDETLQSDGRGDGCWRVRSLRRQASLPRGA